MTVAEYIKKLECMPRNMEVWTHEAEGGEVYPAGDPFIFETTRIEDGEDIDRRVVLIID